MEGRAERSRLWSALALALGLTASACGTRAEPGQDWLARWSGPATVAAGPVELPLERASPAALREAATGPLTLVLAGLKADRPSGGTYNLFVGPPGPARASAGDPGYVGALSLFDLAGDPEGGERAFPLSPQARAALLGDRAKPLTLTIVPRGGDGSPLVVGEVRLVGQAAR
jgi:hypothetical protein